MPSFLPGALEYNKPTLDALVSRIHADMLALEGLIHPAVTVSNPIKLSEQALSLGYDTNQFQLDASNNLQLKALAATNWQPSWSSLTIGSGGTNAGGYYQCPLTKIVWYWFEVTLGSSGFSVGAASFALPVTAATYSLATKIGDITCAQGSTIREGCIISSGALRIYQPTAATGYITRVGLSSTVPFTWAAGNTIAAQGWYRGA